MHISKRLLAAAALSTLSGLVACVPPAEYAVCAPGDKQLCSYTGDDGNTYDGKQVCGPEGNDWGDCGPLDLPSSDGGSGGEGGGETGGMGGAGGSSPDSELAVLYPVDQAPGSSLLQDAQMVAMLKVNFAALGDQTVESLRFKRFGVGSGSEVSQVMVYNDQLPWVDCDYDSQTGIADCGNLGYAVADGTSGYAMLYVSFENAQVGSEHGWEIEDASDVVLATSGKVTGSFPVKGNLFAIAGQQ